MSSGEPLKTHRARVERVAALGRTRVTLWTSSMSTDALREIAKAKRLRGMGDALDLVITSLARHPELRKDLGL
jgi:uncharacterized membrane protein YccC